MLSLAHYQPASSSTADMDACQRVYDESAALFAGPLFKGSYPAAHFEWLGPHQPRVAAGDLQTISEPCDYLGVNYYMTMSVAHAPSGGYLKTAIKQVSAPGWGQTEVGWGVNPSGLTAVLLDVSRTYGAANIMVTENGTAFPELPGEGGYVADAARVRYLREHLLAVHDAIQAGAPVTGYYVWSLMDNFEWSQGYRPRFGLVRVDYATQQRIPKQSAGWYAGVIARNGLEE